MHATIDFSVEKLDGLSHSEDKITTEQFVTLIIRSSKGEPWPREETGSFRYLDYALAKGIIEDYDIINKSKPIERRAAARIIHETLLTELAEKDEDEWSAAEKLMDLYSCRTCVRHIAQVYVKGIMFSRDHNVFDVTGNMTFSEAVGIIARVLDRKKRIPQLADREIVAKMLQPDEAMELLKEPGSMLIDVRTHEEYKQGHIEGSRCIPLHDISLNPFTVSFRKDAPIILYCQKGYKSSLAAQELIAAGYSHIYIIPGIEQYRYHITG